MSASSAAAASAAAPSTSAAGLSPSLVRMAAEQQRRQQEAARSSRRPLRWLLLALAFAGLLVSVLAFASVISQWEWPAPLAALTGLASHPIHSAPATCSMSYFSLSHRRVEVDSLSDVSTQLLDGAHAAPWRAGDSAAAEFDRNSGGRRAAGEFDDEDEEPEPLVQRDSVLAPAAGGTTPASELTPLEHAQAAQFDSWRRALLSALPLAASPNSTARYRLYEYVETVGGAGGREEKYIRRGPKAPKHNKRPRVPLLFIHGNGGSYAQSRSLFTRLRDWAASDRDEALKADSSGFSQSAYDSHVPDLVDPYALEMFEESPAMGGLLLVRQAWFANEALTHVLRSYPPTMRAVLVGHSMGGVLLGLMQRLGNHPLTSDGTSRVSMAVALGSPMSSPVIEVDRDMQSVYRLALGLDFTTDSAATGAGAAAGAGGEFDFLHPFVRRGSMSRSTRGDMKVVSVGGGERDWQVEAALTVLPSASSSSAGERLSVLTRSLPHSPSAASLSSGVDHQALAWCAELVDVVAAAVRGEVGEILASQKDKKKKKGESEGVDHVAAAAAKRRALWVPQVVDMLRSIASASLTTSTPSSSTGSSWTRAITASELASSGGVSIPFPSEQSLALQGVVVVWRGRASAVKLCSPASSSAGSESTGDQCTELTSRVGVLDALDGRSHPALAHLTQEEVDRRLLRRQRQSLAEESAFVLHISRGDLLSLVAGKGARVELALHPLVRTLASQRPASEVLGVAMGYSAMQTLDPAAATLRHGVYRWTDQLEAGVEKLLSFSSSSPAMNAASNLLPSVVALFAAAAPSNSSAAAEAIEFDPSIVADQLFVVYPAASEQHTVHFHRSGSRRTAVGLVLVLPRFDGGDGGDSAAAPGVATVTLSPLHVASFARTLFLLFPLLPQTLLGVALVLFGAQHESLRTRLAFPRVRDVLALTAPLGGLPWVLAALLGGCVCLFASPLSASSSASASAAVEQSMWSSWVLRSPLSGELVLPLAGLVLLSSCAAVVLLLDQIVFWLLRLGNTFFRAAWAAARGTLGLTRLGRSLRESTLLRRLVLVVAVMHLTLAAAFTLCLSLVDLRVFGSMRLGDSVHFTLQQLVAWLSTLAMIAGLIEEHFYFERDVLGFVARRMVLAEGVSVVGLTVAALGSLAILATLTFPDLRDSTLAEFGQAKVARVRSNAHYKSSVLTVGILFAVVFLAPQLIASTRLDVGAIEAAWNNSGGMHFQPPGARKVYDASLTMQSDPDSDSPSLFLYPFVVRSAVDPLSLSALTLLTLLSWCQWHVPFSPPILQSAVISTYGFVLIFVRGPSVALAQLWWFAMLLSACMLPHCLASMLFLVNVIADSVEGREGQYDLAYEQERARIIQQQQEGAADQPAAGAAPTGKAKPLARDNKKNK